MTGNMHMEEDAWQRCRNGRQLNWRRKQSIKHVLKGPWLPWAGEAISKKAGIGVSESSGAQIEVPLSVGVSGAGAAIPDMQWSEFAVGQLLCLWVFATCGTQTQGVFSWIPSTRVILGKAEFSFCHKGCDTGDSEDISDDAEDNWTETGPVFSHCASLAMDFLSCMVNFTKYHKSL